MRSFGEMFPDSTDTLRAKHYRVFILKTKLLRYYYSLKAPSHLIDKSRLTPGSIPVLINNFNRLKTLKLMIKWLESLSTPVSILIIDNASTYGPLLDYYKDLNFGNIQVIKFEENNELRKILPMSMALKNFDKYVVTDADLIPYEDTPKDIFERMSAILDSNPHINHVGPSLEINDIPDHYPLKEDVLEWESQFWSNRNCNFSFKAEVDTTMGMYRKSSLVTKMTPALRLDRPYTLKHVDWYLNASEIDDEHRYYLDHCTSVSTWNTKLKRAL